MTTPATESVGTRMARLLRTTPYRFQIRGVRFVEDRGGRAIIADQMGLGKTLQAIAWLALHPEARPAVVVCPSSMKWQWQRELWGHARIRSSVLSGQRPLRQDMAEPVWVINYDILRFWADTINAQAPRALIVDECQRIKNPRAKRARAVAAVGKAAPHIIALSGTPIISRPIEFFPVLQLIAPGEYRSRWQFAFRYCAPKRGWQGRGWDFSGASHLEELHERVGKLMIRRMRADVLPDLPHTQRTVVPIEIDNRKEYDRAVARFIEWLAERRGADAAVRAMRAEAVVKLGALKHLAAEGKMAAAVEMIQEWLEDTDEKLVVFAIHHSIIDRLCEAFPTAAVVTGKVTGADRVKAVDRFQQDPKCRLFLGNIQAAGEGITLHAASNMLVLELGWTPAEHDQAEDRINRIGQRAAHVDVRYIVAQGTIEERVLALINSKRDTVSRVVDGRATNDTISIPDAIIGELMKEHTGAETKA